MLNISKVETFYGNIQALRGVDIKVNDGEIVVLIGSNGAGKSRQGLPQPSSHGSAIPRRSSHFGDLGASLLGCRLRVRQPAKVSKRRDAGQPRLH